MWLFLYLELKNNGDRVEKKFSLSPKSSKVKLNIGLQTELLFIAAKMFLKQNNIYRKIKV
ncbi:MAG: hypothetical protein F6K22_38160 [Okeania sp. SIO2F4]|nr:hypothetical protein [Okeania sp. SIO2F4]